MPPLHAIRLGPIIPSKSSDAPQAKERRFPTADSGVETTDPSI